MKSYEGKNLEKKLEKIIKACEDKIAHDVVSVKLDPQGALADYFVIATGNTPNQTQSIIDEVEDVCEKEGYEILGKEAGKDGLANFIKIKHGKGFIYLHSEPLILTNYYLLKPENERYLQSLFSLLPLRETIWFVGANDEAFESNSVLRFILSKPALRYAWWLLLGGLLLFIIFNAKRKQRIVPIIEPLTNKSVEFVKIIGNLYLQEGDLHDMMAKKAQYFLYHVRTDLLIDTKNLDDNFEKMLHLKTGKSMDKIKKTTDFIKKAQNPNASVVKEDLIKMNELLDDILN